MSTPALRFGLAEGVAAGEWGFNCGPAAVCAMLGMTPAELRPHLLDFEARGYTNPTLMASILRGLKVHTRPVFTCAGPREAWNPIYPAPGLVRIQWAGPWTQPGVPVAARYRKTHWVAMRGGTREQPAEVFDVNALSAGGWLPWTTWALKLVPWLLKNAVPKADGRWWPTHCWELHATIACNPSAVPLESR